MKSNLLPIVQQWLCYYIRYNLKFILVVISFVSLNCCPKFFRNIFFTQCVVYGTFQWLLLFHNTIVCSFLAAVLLWNLPQSPVNKCFDIFDGHFGFLKTFNSMQLFKICFCCRLGIVAICLKLRNLMLV